MAWFCTTIKRYKDSLWWFPFPIHIHVFLMYNFVSLSLEIYIHLFCFQIFIVFLSGFMLPMLAAVISLSLFFLMQFSSLALVRQRNPQY